MPVQYQAGDLTTYMNETLGYTVPMRVPTFEAFRRIIGDEACHKMLCSMVAYHKFNGTFRETLANKVADETGVAIPQDGNKTTGPADKPVPVLISEKKYIAKMIADGLITEARVAQLAQEVANAMEPVDITAAERKVTVSKEAISQANAYMARFNQNEFTAEQWIAKYDASNPQKPFATINDGAFTAENLAIAIAENTRRVTEEAKRNASVL